MQYHVKRRWSLFSCALLAGIGYFFLARFYLPLDHEGYQKLLDRANPAFSMEEKRQYQAQQMRDHVQKDLWFKKNGQRLHLHLSGDESEIVYQREGDDTQIIELLKRAACYFQEEMYFVLPDGREGVRYHEGKLLLRDSDPVDDRSWVDIESDRLTLKQKVHYLASDKADFYYKSNRLHAENVTIKTYLLDGHEMIVSVPEQEPYSEGFANSIEMSLLENKWNIDADRFKGKLYSSMRL